MGFLSCVLLLGGQAYAVDAFEPMPPPELHGDSDASLVPAGQRYLAAGRLGHAVDVLSYAVHTTSDPQAHLGLAQALAAIRVQHPAQACSWGAFSDEVDRHARAAVLGGAIAADDLPQLPNVHAVLSHSLAYRTFVDRKALRAKRVADVIVEVNWVDAQHARLRLLPNGAAASVTLEDDVDGAAHPSYRTGSWSVHKGVVTLALDGTPPAALTLTEAGLGPWHAHQPDCPVVGSVWSELDAKSSD